MKKFLIYLLVLSLLVLGIVACTKKDDVEQGTAPATDPAPTESTESDTDTSDTSGAGAGNSGAGSSGGTQNTEAPLIFGEMTDDDQHWTPNY